MTKFYAIPYEMRLVYLQRGNKRRRSTKEKAKYISLSYESLLIKNRARDRKIKVWMYKQICSPMIGVTSCAILVGMSLNIDGSIRQRKLLEILHFPNLNIHPLAPPLILKHRTSSLSIFLPNVRDLFSLAV